MFMGLRAGAVWNLSRLVHLGAASGGAQWGPACCGTESLQTRYTVLSQNVATVCANSRGQLTRLKYYYGVR